MRKKIRTGNITRFVNIPDKPEVISPAQAKEANSKSNKKSNKKTGGK